MFLVDTVSGKVWYLVKYTNIVENRMCGFTLIA
jgi:hypothetical protein